MLKLIETMGNFFHSAFETIDYLKRVQHTELVVQKQKATMFWMGKKICDKFINQTPFEYYLDCERLANQLTIAWNGKGPPEQSSVKTMIGIVPIWHRLRDRLDDEPTRTINLVVLILLPFFSKLYFL